MAEQFPDSSQEVAAPIDLAAHRLARSQGFKNMAAAVLVESKPELITQVPEKLQAHSADLREVPHIITEVPDHIKASAQEAGPAPDLITEIPEHLRPHQ
jgi:hypothetical protein